MGGKGGGRRARLMTPGLSYVQGGRRRKKTSSEVLGRRAIVALVGERVAGRACLEVGGRATKQAALAALRHALLCFSLALTCADFAQAMSFLRLAAAFSFLDFVLYLSWLASLCRSWLASTCGSWRLLALLFACFE